MRVALLLCNGVSCILIQGMSQVHLARGWLVSLGGCCAASAQAVGRSCVLLQELWQVQLPDGRLDGLDSDRRAQLLHRLLLEADHLIRPSSHLADLQTSSRIHQSSERRQEREWCPPCSIMCNQCRISKQASLYLAWAGPAHVDLDSSCG